MISKWKTIINQSFSRPLFDRQNVSDANLIMQEMQEVPTQILQSTSSINGKSMGSKILLSREQAIRCHKKSYQVTADMVQCKDRLNSPKTSPCHYPFCSRCIKNQVGLSDNRGGKKERNTSRITVTFEPLPARIRNKRSPIFKCRICRQACENKCKHCKCRFCFTCWTSHVNDLKDELGNINKDLETSATKFQDRILNFQSTANQTREFINREIEGKIAELNEKREKRIEKVEEILAAGKTSIEVIKRKIQKAQLEIRRSKESSYDLLPDNEEKVNTFLKLQQKTVELMTIISIWELELNNIEVKFEKTKKHEESLVQKNTGSLYKRKSFAPKVIVNRDTVQRPSALAIDTWRDHIIVTCPGSGQIVILDKKFKLIRRIRHRDMMAPQGVAFCQEQEEIYVTDKWKHCVFVFDGKGEFLRRICSKGQGESQLRSPEGITFRPQRNLLYIADTGNNRIQILEKNGTYVGSIGPIGRPRKVSQTQSQLNQPTDVAVTTMRVAVADCGNHKVKIFDHNGQILQTIGDLGTSKGLFRLPVVLKFDEIGNIIVGDAGNGRVQIFSSEGECLRILKAKENKKTQFGWVSGVLVTNNYNIFVADSRNNVIYLL